MARQPQRSTPPPSPPKDPGPPPLTPEEIKSQYGLPATLGETPHWLYMGQDRSVYDPTAPQTTEGLFGGMAPPSNEILVPLGAVTYTDPDGKKREIPAGAVAQDINSENLTSIVRNLDDRPPEQRAKILQYLASNYKIGPELITRKLTELGRHDLLADGSGLEGIVGSVPALEEQPTLTAGGVAKAVGSGLVEGVTGVEIDTAHQGSRIGLPFGFDDVVLDTEDIRSGVATTTALASGAVNPLKEPAKRVVKEAAKVGVRDLPRLGRFAREWVNPALKGVKSGAVETGGRVGQGLLEGDPEGAGTELALDQIMRKVGRGLTYSGPRGRTDTGWRESGRTFKDAAREKRDDIAQEFESHLDIHDFAPPDPGKGFLKNLHQKDLPKQARTREGAERMPPHVTERGDVLPQTSFEAQQEAYYGAQRFAEKHGFGRIGFKEGAVQTTARTKNPGTKMTGLTVDGKVVPVGLPPVVKDVNVAPHSRQLPSPGTEEYAGRTVYGRGTTAGPYEPTPSDLHKLRTHPKQPDAPVERPSRRTRASGNREQEVLRREQKSINRAAQDRSIAFDLRDSGVDLNKMDKDELIEIAREMNLLRSTQKAVVARKAPGGVRPRRESIPVEEADYLGSSDPHAKMMADLKFDRNSVHMEDLKSSIQDRFDSSFKVGSFGAVKDRVDLPGVSHVRMVDESGVVTTIRKDNLTKLKRADTRRRNIEKAGATARAKGATTTRVATDQKRSARVNDIIARHRDRAMKAGDTEYAKSIKLPTKAEIAKRKSDVLKSATKAEKKAARKKSREALKDRRGRGGYRQDLGGKKKKAEKPSGGYRQDLKKPKKMSDTNSPAGRVLEEEGKRKKTRTRRRRRYGPRR